MADPSPSSNQSSTTITDLNQDSLVHCASFLRNLQDLSNLAMSCKLLKSVAYSDAIWQRFFWECWPGKLPSLSQAAGVREAYLFRHTAVQQFKFIDPLIAELYTDAIPCSHVLLDKSDIIFSKGSLIQIMKVDSFLSGRDSIVTLTDHNARITCMRLFPLNETSLFRSKTNRNENVLVTSSCDHSIRLWWKGSCQRCFRGHNGPVSTLSDKLLGDDTSKIFASGGEDGTVRLWSLSSSGKRGQRALKATLYGHEKPVKFMSVAGHKTSLLASISNDSKVRLWDTTTSSAVRSSCCVGMTSAPGVPVGMKCHGSLLYVAAGSSVVAIDLRTMQKVITAALFLPKLYSFEITPLKSMICTGAIGKAMLWDIRKNQGTLKPEPVAELDGHQGSITLLHMDSYKIITGGPEDPFVNVWEAGSGRQTNSLLCCSSEAYSYSGCTAMAVKGCQIVTASCGEAQGLLCFRDFASAGSPALTHQDEPLSKFWGPQSNGDSDSDGSDG